MFSFQVYFNEQGFHLSLSLVETDLEFAQVSARENMG